MQKYRPIVLVVLDGWGMSEQTEGNAIYQANTPFFDQCWQKYPHSLLESSGLGVGLPQAKAGNSETGHMNIGAGFIVEQDVLRISHDMSTGSFRENPVMHQIVQHITQQNSTLHIMGLLSDANVHSEITHLHGILEFLKTTEVKNIVLHMFTDGRDSSPTDGLDFVAQLQEYLMRLNIGKIGSLIGRYYAMDRDRRWDRTQIAYDALVSGTGLIEKDPIIAIKNAYARGETDEYIKPILISDAFKPISSSDAVLFFNFRTDRPRQLVNSFIKDDFVEFTRDKKLENLYFATMTEYEKNLAVSGICYPSFHVENPLSKVLSDHGLKQLHVAESEKRAHVTYFFNGGHEQAFAGEDRIIIDSPKVGTYDHDPKMRANEITAAVIDSLHSETYDFILLNYANPDMVAHTGNLAATIEGIEEVDQLLQKLTEEILKINGCLLITSDHGNAEKLYDEVYGVDTEHNVYPSPFIFISNDLEKINVNSGVLSDIAPTILQLLEIQKPSSMTSKSLLVQKTIFATPK